VTPLVWSVGFAGAALLLLALAELGARWCIRLRARYYVWPPGARYDIRLSPDLSPPLEARVRFDVNRDGERGSDVRGADRGLYRILVAGGSPVESFLSDQATSWHGALERALATPESLRTLRAARVHVGNIGRSGVAAQELDLIFERVLPRYRRLDAILVMVGGNDVFHWLERGAPSPYPAAPVPVRRFFACHPEGPFTWRPAQWALVELTRRLRRRWLRPLEVWERAGEWIAEARAMRARAAELRSTVPDPSVMLERFERHLRRLLQRACAHARRVLVVRQPWFEKDYTPEEASYFWHGGMGLPWREVVTVYYSLEVVNRLMGLVDSRVAHVAEELGIEHLDLNPVLVPSLDNYQDYVHYTPAGSAVVARAVAGALLRALPAQPGVTDTPESGAAEASLTHVDCNR